MALSAQGGDAALRLQRILASIRTVACAHPAASPLVAAAPQPAAAHLQEELAAAGEMHRAVVRLYHEAEPQAPVLAPPDQAAAPALPELVDVGEGPPAATLAPLKGGQGEGQTAAGVAAEQRPAGVVNGDTDMLQAQGEEEDEEVCALWFCQRCAVLMCAKQPPSW